MNISPGITVTLNNYYKNHGGTTFLFVAKSTTEANKYRTMFTITDETISGLQAWKKELLATTKKQGCNYLIQDSAYCCLGILGSISLDMAKYEGENIDTGYLTESDFSQCISLISSQDATQILQNFFSYLNDKLLYSFAQIAEVVQEFIDAFEAALSEQISPKICYTLTLEKDSYENH